MTVVFRRPVVVVVNMRADAVHQRRMKWIQTLTAAEHAGCCRPRVRTQRLNRQINCRVETAANRAADVIDEGAPGFVPDVRGNVFEATIADVGREDLSLGHKAGPVATPRSVRSSNSSAVRPRTGSKLAVSSPNFEPGIGLKSVSIVARPRPFRAVSTKSRALSGWPLTAILVADKRLPQFLTALCV